MEWTYDAPIFDEMVRLNPWAEHFWRERNELVCSKRWNVNAVNQGGNNETTNWLKAFLAARSQATLELLQKDTEAYDLWATNVGMIAKKVFADKAIAEARPGTPVHRISENAWGLDWNATVEGYSLGQFKADFLLLAQSSLRDLEIKEPIGISKKMFPIGLDGVGTRFQAPLIATKAGFGPFSEFSFAHFDDADFSAAQFFGHTAFTISEFTGLADFSQAKFHDHTTFDAARFKGRTDFSHARFEESAQFNGTLFETRPDFSQAMFKGDTSFADSTFNDTAIFNETSFPGRVFVGRIPDDVKKMIIEANYPDPN